MSDKENLKEINSIKTNLMEINLLVIEEVLFELKRVNVTADYVYQGMVNSPHMFEPETADFAFHELGESYQKVLAKLEDIYNEMKQANAARLTVAEINENPALKAGLKKAEQDYLKQYQ